MLDFAVFLITFLGILKTTVISAFSHLKASYIIVAVAFKASQ